MISLRAIGSVVIASKGKGKGNAFGVHAMKVYGWSKDMAPLILNLGP
jgi:hypothetical protein